MKLPPVNAILAGAVVLASLALMPFFQNTDSSPWSLFNWSQFESQWISVTNLQRATPQDDAAQLAVAEPKCPEYVEPAQLTITSLPPIDSLVKSASETELPGSPQFIKKVTYASPTDSQTIKPLEPASQIPEPVNPAVLATLETEISKAESSILAPPAEPTLLIQFDDEPVLDSTLEAASIPIVEDVSDKDDNDFDIEDFNGETLDELNIQPEGEAAFTDDTGETLEDQSAYQTEVIFEHIRSSRVTAAEHEIRWSLNDAIMAALVYSNRVTSLQIESIEELQNVGVESGEFDVVGFLDQSFRNSSEPVGSTIETASGAQSVIQEEDINIAYGWRKQLRSGGEVEFNQSYQFRDNDSGILIPDDQAFSRVNARVTKELLRGAGRSIALNEVLVAFHDASAQQAESVSEIADHLTDVMTAYWDIFAARGALFASMENRELAIEVLNELEARKGIDAERNLLDQARATLGQRELLITNAHNDLIQAQIRLVSLVNAPELLANRNSIEILPQFEPDLQPHHLDVDSRINTAIQRRPEITDAIEQIKSAQVTDHVSLNELLPRLSTSIEAGLNGLAGDRSRGSGCGLAGDGTVPRWCLTGCPRGPCSTPATSRFLRGLSQSAGW